MRHWDGHVDGNLFLDERQRDAFRKNGWDLNSQAGDPMFVDPAKGDYRVRDGSPALGLGFKNFPMDRFGVQKPALKAIARTPKLPVVNLSRLEEETEDVAPVAWMGATLKALVGQEFSAFGVGKEEGGLHVIALPADAPAAGMGLKQGDVVQSVNGRPTPSAEAFSDAVKDITAGQPLELGLVRYQNAVVLHVDGRRE